MNPSPAMLISHAPRASPGDSARVMAAPVTVAMPTSCLLIPNVSRPASALKAIPALVAIGSSDGGLRDGCALGRRDRQRRPPGGQWRHFPAAPVELPVPECVLRLHQLVH